MIQASSARGFNLGFNFQSFMLVEWLKLLGISLFLLKESRLPTGSLLAAFVLALGLAACTPAPVVVDINDPFEADNRKTHAANKELDRTLLKPISGAYGSVADGPVSQGVDNFASNLALPGTIVNDILQLNLPDFFSNTARFVLNTTFGIGGIFDVATQNGVPVKSSDFGETLYVWGVPEGRYIELPALGPSTERDALGTVVDFVIDPINYFVPAPQRYIGTVASAFKMVGNRSRYAGLVESVLYESEDSYAQSRLLYLQSRRRELTGELTEEDLEDPYAE